MNARDRLGMALLTWLFTALLLGCAPTPPGELARSDKERVTTAAPPADVEAAVQGNTAFALDVYRALAAKEGNLVFSPASVTTALAMTYAGARGETAAAFERTLHLGLPSDRFHRAMNTLDAAWRSRGAGAKSKSGEPFRLSITNQLFAQTDFELVASFLDLLAGEYGAGVRLLDFAARSERARTAINDWVKASTEGLIPELLPQGSITTDTRLVLVNTIYFNAAWLTQFDPRRTTAADFELLDGSKASVPTMAGEDLEGARGTLDGVLVLELPYDGREVSLVLLVPPSGSFGDFERALSPDVLQAHLAALQPGTFGVKLPKFEVRTPSDLEEVLEGLGLAIAFSPDADFTGMSAGGGLAITDVLHEAVIRTDEAGTEAAAATAVVVGKVSLPEYVEVNRPFVFVLRDVATGGALFLGRVVAP